jgi:hypothetical protein
VETNDETNRETKRLRYAATALQKTHRTADQHEAKTKHKLKHSSTVVAVAETTYMCRLARGTYLTSIFARAIDR